MLQISKSTTIVGTSKTSEGEIIATMHCSISEDGKASYTDNIADKTLYERHLKTVRAEQDEFRKYCREVEDALTGSEVTQ